MDNKENVCWWCICLIIGNMCVFVDVFSLLRLEVICWLVMFVLFGIWIWKKLNKLGFNKLYLLVIIEVLEMWWNFVFFLKKILYEFEFYIKNRYNVKLFWKIINIILGF